MYFWDEPISFVVMKNIENHQKLFSKNINILSHEVALNEIVRQIERGEVIFNNFGKNSYLVNPLKKSKMIENILLNIPLPTLYLDVTKETKFRPIDDFGYEFLYAIQEFLANQFTLTNLEFLFKYNDSYYELLPEYEKRSIFWRVISVRYFSPTMPKLEKYVIMNRLTNKSLLKAQDLEPKLLTFFSETKKAVRDKVQFLPKNIDLTELISAFVAFYLEGKNFDKNTNFQYFKNKVLLQIDLEDQELLCSLREKLKEALKNLLELEQNKNANPNWYLCLLVTLANEENVSKIMQHKDIFIKKVHNKHQNLRSSYLYNLEFIENIIKEL